MTPEMMDAGNSGELCEQQVWILRVPTPLPREAWIPARKEVKHPSCQLASARRLKDHQIKKMISETDRGDISLEQPQKMGALTAVT